MSKTKDQRTPLRMLLDTRDQIDSMLIDKLTGFESEFVLALNVFCNTWVDKNYKTPDHPLTFGK